MADEKRTLDDETTEMASPEEMQAILEETTPPPQREEASTDDEEVTPIPQFGLNLSSFRDRAAAGILDLLALGYLYCGLLLTYNFIAWGQLLRPIPIQGTHTIIFHSLFGLLSFLYFFISEGVFFTSPGKFLSGLSVRNAQGGPASLLSITLRNLLRPIDYLLLILPTWILLEKTPKRQRLGDLLSGTVVMKHYGRAPMRFSVTGHTASATVRLISSTIDFVASAVWVGGLLLWIDNQAPLLSFFIILLTPLFYLSWHLMWEGLFQTTLGQSIFSLKLVGEDGVPIGFSEALIRAVFKLVDTNPIGWIVLFLSNKNQKICDLAAGTVSVYAKRSWQVLIAVGISFVLLAGVWVVGLANPRSYLTPFFRPDFLSKIFTIKTGSSSNNLSEKGLFIKQFTFLEANRKTPRASAEFKPGETVIFSFDITGFIVRDNEAWIQEDLAVRYPDNAIGFKQENIVDFHQMLKKPEIPLDIVNTLALPPTAQPGHYTLVLLLHDRFSDHHLTEQRTFLVTAP